MPDAYNPWAAPVFPTADDNAMQPETYRNPAATSLISQIGGAIGHALMYPGLVAQSKVPISTEDMIAPAFNMASMLTLGAGAAPQEANSLNMGIKAYHGSPHDFDKFDLSKIGTGEGAQAYGHGLYFAENPETARSYRDVLSRPSDDNPLWRLNGEPVAHGTPNWSLASALDNVVLKPGEAVPDMLKRRIGELDEQANFASKAYGQQVGEMYANKADKLRSIDPNALTHNPPGKMYEVNINADPSHFLDWDKPLSPDVLAKVQAAAQNIKPSLYERMMGQGKDLAKWGLQPENISPGLTGESAVGSLRRGLGSDAAASQALHEAGVPGIKYLDQGSRGAGEGSSNYVVFNHDLIDIMRKYAVPGMLGAPILANALSEQKT